MAHWKNAQRNKVQRFIEIMVQERMDVWWRELTIWTLTDGNTYETPVI